MKGVKLTHDLVNAKTGKSVADAGAKMTPRLLDPPQGGRASRRCASPPRS